MNENIELLLSEIKEDSDNLNDEIKEYLKTNETISDEIKTKVEKLNSKKEKFTELINEFHEKEKKIEELNKIITDLQTIPKAQRIVLDTYLIKLITNSSLFTKEEKESINLIVEDFEMSKEKELELNNIEEIKENVDASDWKANTNYIIGDYVKYNDNLYKVIQSHFSLINWTPNIVPAVYLLLAEKEEIEVIDDEYPDWKQPLGSHDAYKIGDKVKFNTKIYESLINNNTWSPSVYPAGWRLI